VQDHRLHDGIVTENFTMRGGPCATMLAPVDEKYFHEWPDRGHFVRNAALFGAAEAALRSG
jgi:hypothetical protein